jgi:hypothetical protein
MVVHAYHSGYLGGRDWEDHGLRPAQAKSKTPCQQLRQAWYISAMPAKQEA